MKLQIVGSYTADTNLGRSLRSMHLDEDTCFFQGRDYGPMIAELVVLMQCFRPGIKVPVMNRYDCVSHTFFVHVNLDHGEMVAATHRGRARIVLEALRLGVPTALGRFERKGFPLQRFSADLQHWIEHYPEYLDEDEPIEPQQAIIDDRFYEAAQRSFGDLVDKLGLSFEGKAKDKRIQMLGFADAKRSLMVMNGPLVGTIRVSTSPDYNATKQMRSLRLDYAHVPSSGRVSVDLYSDGMTNRGPVGYVKITRPGDMLEALQVFADLIASDPTIAFPVKRSRVSKKEVTDMNSSQTTGEE